MLDRRHRRGADGGVHPPTTSHGDRVKGPHLRLGVLIGAAVFLAGNFVTQGVTDSSSGLTIFWAGLGLGLGLLVAFALERTARAQPEASGDEAFARFVSGEMKPLIPTSSRFYAVSREPSSAELKALMVDAPTIPGNPISTRLQLIVERYDAYARISLSEGSWLDYDVWEVAERVRDAATSRAPVTHAEVSFELVWVLSEGPLDEWGRSPAGWSFEFVDGSLGARCIGTVSASELLLVYDTAVSYPRSVEMARLDPRRAVAAVREAWPHLADEPLYLRVELPNEYLVWSPWARVFFQLQVVEGRLVERDTPLSLTAPERDDAVTVESLVETLTIGADTPFRRDLLACRRRALSEAARELFAAHGPVVVEELAAAARRLAAESPEAARSLVHVLGHVPSHLAQLTLERLADELPAEMEGIAFSLFEKRRHEELALHTDPFGGLDFEESRALLGKTGCRRLALRSTYDPENDLLAGLERYGLRVTRVRLLSGDTELLLSANLSTDDRRTDALVSSSPLPVPCHVIRIVGPQAAELAERLHTSDLVYPNDRLVEDVLGGRPYDIHKGALYIAAMGLDAPQTFEALKEAIARHRTNLELRRACLAAMTPMTHPEVDAFLATLDDADVADVVRDVTVARVRRPGGETPTGAVVEEAGV
jgi:hypothetical protein